MILSKNITGIIWSFIERLSSQLISLIIGIILARLLTPDDYGTIGILTIFIMLSNVFVESGFGNALIRKNNRTEADCSTALYFNIIVGIVLYAILFFTSSLIADFFDTPILRPLTRIVALNILFGSLCVVQRSLLTAALEIKLQTKITIIAQIPSGIIAIIMAYYGFGVYSLAVQQVGMQLLSMLLLWKYSAWRPKTGFSKVSFRYLWGFGSKLVAASFIGVLFDQIYSFIIGKYINKKQLGYYSKAQSLATLPCSIVNGVIQKIIIPIFSENQNNINFLREQYRKYVRFLFFTTVPLSFILLISAKAIIQTFWGNQWLQCVWMFQCLIISGLLLPLNTINLLLLQVLNRTDITLKLEFIKKPLYVVIIVLSLPYGIKGILASVIINTLIANMVNAYPTKILIGYGVFLQITDILYYVIVSSIVYLPLYFVGRLFSGTIFILCEDILFITLYLLVLKLIKDDSLNLIYGVFNQLKKQ